MKVFLDANIILDVFDTKRAFHLYSMRVYEYLLKHNHQIFTSCDLITTIYYVLAKIDKTLALTNVQKIVKTLRLIRFSNEEIELACDLMLRDEEYKDLEDTLQYLLAKKQQCNIILSNDKNFISKDIEILDTKEFFEKFIK